jgi:ADP-dependent phosphofructokinase/glucokinase
MTPSEAHDPPPRPAAADYAGALRRLPGHVAGASLTLCGMGACVDARVSMHQMDALLSASAPPAAVALAGLLRERAGHGVGGEVFQDWPDGPRWLAEQVPVRYALGGSGPQAAWVLTVAGAPALVALQDRSAHMLARLDPRLLLADGDQLTPAGRVAPRGVARSDIFIFEYTAGMPVGDRLPPRSSRVIVRFSNHGLEHDPDFERASVRHAGRAGAALVSGFSAVPASDLPSEVARVAALTRRWRAAGVATVHLELAGYETPEMGEAVLAGLRGAITSVGMSQSEFLAMTGHTDLASGMRALAERFDVDRLCVHADHWAATATTGDPSDEHEALLIGCLFASARAAAGQPVRPDRIDPRARFSSPPFPRPERHGRWALVSCPSPYLEAPATTLGLGDTFAAGCLLVLGQRPLGQRPGRAA